MAEPLKYSDMNEVVIKTCLDCGHTQRLPYRYFECPSCESLSFGFFNNINHLIGYIDRYGLGKLKIIDDDIRQEIIKAFS